MRTRRHPWKTPATSVPHCGAPSVRARLLAIGRSRPLPAGACVRPSAGSRVPPRPAVPPPSPPAPPDCYALFVRGHPVPVGSRGMPKGGQALSGLAPLRRAPGNGGGRWSAAANVERRHCTIGVRMTNPNDLSPAVAQPSRNYSVGARPRHISSKRHPESHTHERAPTPGSQDPTAKAGGLQLPDRAAIGRPTAVRQSHV